MNLYFGDICNYTIYASQFILIMKIRPINHVNSIAIFYPICKG